MGPLDLLIHFINFAAPALVVGAVVAMAGYLFAGKSRSARMMYIKTAINCVAGFVALALGLWFFGRDGKMASYAALVLTCACSQWWLRRGR